MLSLFKNRLGIRAGDMPGDLNLKKAWHPTTRANLEKVFLAEKAQEEEEKKIKELQKEREMERGSEVLKLNENERCANLGPQRLDWLYQESLAQNSSTYTAKRSNTTNHSKFPDKKDLLDKCDLWNKKNEDPLFR